MDWKRSSVETIGGHGTAAAGPKGAEREAPGACCVPARFSTPDVQSILTAINDPHAS
jgi:hypothetical protein